MIGIRTTRTRAAFSRRRLLAKLGASAAMLPLLRPGPASATTGPGGFPKRIITIAMTNGVVAPRFYPADDADPTSGEILAPLAPWRSKVLIPVGLDVRVMNDSGLGGSGHATYPALFTGTSRKIDAKTHASTGPSIDHVISEEIARSVNLPVPLLNFELAGRSTSYRGAGQRNTAETSTTRLFERLFASPSAPAGELATLRARRKSVLDFLARDLTAFGNRLGAEERAKIGAHLEAVRKLERELSVEPTRACAGAEAPRASDYPGKMKALNAMVAAAIRCDVTRVVSLTWADDGGSWPDTLTWLGGVAYHDTSHAGAPAYARKAEIDRWYFTQVADLVRQLAAAPEGSGTALDNTVVVVANDMNSGEKHIAHAIPFVLVGSCGGYLRTGRAVRLSNIGRSGYWFGGVPHNRLLTTLCNAMGVAVDGFGAPAYKGALPELRA